MKHKKRMIICLLFASFSIFVFLISPSFVKIMSLPDGMFVDYDEVEQANNHNYFGKFVNAKLDKCEINTSNSIYDGGEIVFKLFGFIPIKKLQVKIFPEQEINVGGSLIGLNVEACGALVVSNNFIDACTGKVLKNDKLIAGDVIQAFNSVEIESVDDLLNAISDSENEQAIVSVYRKGKFLDVNVPLIKSQEGYKLGIWVRDNMAGVGTLSFVDVNTGDFAALGHAITNGQDDSTLPITGGEVYLSTLVNIEKGTKNHPGELQCVFVERNLKGTVEQNSKVGIFGVLDDIEDLVDINKRAKLGGRLGVKPGPAKLVSCVSGIQEEYDIEIIKVNNQRECNDKSFVFRVKDDKLLALTGGIVQGMSGSPILQDGKIIGAVTHVFIADSTKGYGVYSDWMIEKIKNPGA